MPRLKLILQFNAKFIILLLFLMVYIIIQTKIITYHSKLDPASPILKGTLVNYSIDGDTLKMLIKSKEKVYATYYLNSSKEKEEILNKLKLGSFITLTGSYKEPLNNTIPNTFNYKKYLYYNKMFYTFNVNSYQIKNKNNIFYNIKDFILKRIYNMSYKEYLLIFILGDKSLIPSEEYNNYITNGTAHLLAISGMHIGLLIGVLNFLLKFLKENIRFIIIILILAFFALLTGFSASVLRVIIFYILSHLNKQFNFNLSSMEILFLTAFILLIYNPFYIFNYGFLYSIITTMGIIYYKDKIKGNYFKKLLILSLIAFLFSLPITATLNYEINLMSPLINLIFVPFVSFCIYPLSLISLIIPNNLWPFAVKCLILLNKININLCIIIPRLNLFLISVYYFILIIGKNKNYFFLSLIFILGIAKLMVKLDPNYYVYFLDVGQGDCTVLISPYQKEVIMIDTGGKTTFPKSSWQNRSKTYHISDNTIKFLKSLGITSIDYLVLSHGDQDHAGEALNILANIDVDSIILNEGEYNDLERKILDYHQNIGKEMNLKYFPNYIIKHELRNNENDNSIINLIRVDNYNFLFLGDVSKKVEEEILIKYKFNYDFVKIAHHGSMTSTSEMLLAQDFKGIISSGRNNRYNHPSEKTIKALNESGHSYYNTQDDGTIFFKIRNSAYTIKCYKP